MSVFCCFIQLDIFAQNLFANLRSAALLQSVQLFKGGKQLFFLVADNRVKAGGNQGSSQGSQELPLAHARANWTKEVGY